MNGITLLDWTSTILTVVGPIVAAFLFARVFGTKKAREAFILEVQAVKNARIQRHTRE